MDTCKIALLVIGRLWKYEQSCSHGNRCNYTHALKSITFLNMGFRLITVGNGYSDDRVVEGCCRRWGCLAQWCKSTSSPNAVIHSFSADNVPRTQPYIQQPSVFLRGFQKVLENIYKFLLVAACKIVWINMNANVY